jgi:hypothetical protein
MATTCSPTCCRLGHIRRPGRRGWAGVPCGGRGATPKPVQARWARLSEQPSTACGRNSIRTARVSRSRTAKSSARFRSISSGANRTAASTGAAYDAFCATLTQDLCDLVNAETGAPAVRRVLRTADHYPGPQLDALPDLLVEWNCDAPLNTVASPKIGTPREGLRETAASDPTKDPSDSPGGGTRSGRTPPVSRRPDPASASGTEPRGGSPV